MKNRLVIILGFIALTSLNTEAKTAQLILRAKVPYNYKVSVNSNLIPTITTNGVGELPKVIINKRPANYLISIIHP